MRNEYEVVPHSQFQYLNVFLVHLLSRTPHIHRDLELGAILEGNVAVKTGGASWKLRKGDMYLVNSMEAHEFVTEGDGTLVLAVQVSPRLMEPFFPNAAMLRYAVDPPLRERFSDAPEQYDALWALCVDLAYQYYGKPEHYELACFQLTASLLYRLSKSLPVKLLSRQDYLPIMRRAERMAPVTDYIDQNFRRKLLLEEIAEKHGLTLTYLSHLFRATLGVTFQEYLREKRFEYASMLIAATDRTILDISMESGFSDVRYLVRLFQEKTGCSPREYRKRLQKLPRRVSVSTESTQHFLANETAMATLTALRICAKNG